MSDGVFRRFVADQIAVRIVIVTCDYRALSVYNGHYIALKIGDVVVENTIVLQRIGIAIGIVEEVQSIAVEAFPQQSPTGIIGVCDNRRYIKPRARIILRFSQVVWYYLN